MKVYRLLLTLLAVLPVSAFAQTDPICKEITTWYLEERFLLADINDDALLTKDEMYSLSNEFAYYLDGRNFDLSDNNRDGRLSFNETQARLKSETLFRYQLETRQLRNLALEHPVLAQADARYLKQHVGLVVELFSNLIWLYENAEMAESLYNDKFWTAAHPEVMVSLHRNLRWMAANPHEARRLYQDRSATQQLPELLGWRADHQDFIRNLPRVERFYELEFIPEGLRIPR